MDKQLTRMGVVYPINKLERLVRILAGNLEFAYDTPVEMKHDSIDVYNIMLDRVNSWTLQLERQAETYVSVSVYLTTAMVLLGHISLHSRLSVSAAVDLVKEFFETVLCAYEMGRFHEREDERAKYFWTKNTSDPLSVYQTSEEE